MRLAGKITLIVLWALSILATTTPYAYSTPIFGYALLGMAIVSSGVAIYWAGYEPGTIRQLKRQELFRKTLAITKTHNWLFQVAQIRHMIMNPAIQRNALDAPAFVRELQHESTEVAGHKNLFYDPIEGCLWCHDPTKPLIHTTPIDQTPESGSKPE